MVVLCCFQQDKKKKKSLPRTWVGSFSLSSLPIDWKIGFQRAFLTVVFSGSDSKELREKVIYMSEGHSILMKTAH